MAEAMQSKLTCEQTLAKVPIFSGLTAHYLNFRFVDLPNL